MRTLTQVAESPEKGDVVIMRTGHIRYTVTDFVTEHTIDHGKVVSERLSAVEVRREAVRSSPHLEDCIRIIQIETWWDLVTYGAASLE